ncbi:MAG: glycine--tRNA ligase subunit beta, partial [Pseudomonadota bacterium]
LCKADLVTEMVGEFPELQGLMGGYYAEKEGLDPQVAAAIRDHYKPVGQGDDVPTAPVTVAVSLADKLDTLTGFFMIDERPTGSKDPFALRRAAVGVIELVVTNNLRIDTTALATSALQMLVKQRAYFGMPEDKLTELKDDISKPFDYLIGFFEDRVKVQQRANGVRHDVIDAVFELGEIMDLVAQLNLAASLQSFIEADNGANLLAGYKRAANILKKEEWDGAEQSLPDTGLSYTPEIDEKALLDALEVAEPEATAAIEAERFEDAMAALASLRGPIDRFFDNVVVNAPEQDKRAARLALLARFRNAVHRVADFSRIEG